MTDLCAICARIDRHRAGTNASVIYEFQHSLWIVGDHQFFPGYTLLLLKAHVRELIDLEPAISVGYYEELMIASGAVRRAYAPWKLNYSSYGNLDPHLHWHIFPRRADEPERTRPPWHFSDRFEAAQIDGVAAAEVALRLRTALAG